MTQKIDVISASAGSGKTYKLMKVMYGEIAGGNVSPDGVMAVTYLKKAATELSTRVRQKLLEGGKVQQAQAMEAARIGTVHSICSRLLSEFSYELGCSPQQRGIDEEAATSLFHEVLGETITSPQEAELRRISLALNYEISQLMDAAFKLCEFARQNDLNSAGIIAAIPESIAQIGRAFPKITAFDFDGSLKTELTKLAAVPGTTDGVKKSTAALETAKRVFFNFQKGTISWRDWLDLASLDGGKKSAALFDPVIEVAAGFLGHPRLHQDLEAGVRLVHEIAAGALLDFEKRKKALGVIDYKDMEQQTLRLLDLPVAQERLKSELQLLLVDEFQDTNPVQLAIFLKLSNLCTKTVWVGDAKQSILGFTGADVTLMRAVLAQIAQGNPEILDKSWRSRKELVDFASDLFVGAFAKDHFVEKEVRLTNGKELKSELRPLAIWNLVGSRQDERWKGLAQEVKRLLDSKVTVIDRVTEQARQIRPGDIAILAFSNDWCESIANALRGEGLDASLASGSLSQQPEVTLALAAFRFAIDRADRLAAAELSILFGFDPDEWLKIAITDAKAETWSPAHANLAALKARCSEFTPLELLDEVIAVAGIESYIERLDGGANRKLNLAALRGLAVKYEERSKESLAPCTAIGFLTYMGSIVGTEADSIPSWSRAGAVDVSTLHRSKGLEWPVVILLGMESKFNDRVDLFGARVVGPEGKNFDANTPLKDRSVRFMPYPFGDKGVDAIDQKMAIDAEYVSLVAKAEAERRRLLYVAITRPREQLIFAIKSGEEFGAETVAGVLKDEGGNPLLQLLGDEPKLFLNGKEVDCEMKEIEAMEASGKRSGEQIRVLPKPVGAAKDFPLMHLSPSCLSVTEEDKVSVTIGQKIDLGGKLLLSGPVSDEMVGNAVHAFFGADLDSLKPEQRMTLAKGILSQWSLDGLIQDSDLVAASDRLKEAISAKWPGCAVTREQPMRLEVKTECGESLIRGILDQLVTAKDEVAVIDHKTTHISEAGLLVRGREHAPQLAAYLLAAKRASKSENGSAWLHFPMSGMLVEVRIQDESSLLNRSVTASGFDEDLIAEIET